MNYDLPKYSLMQKDLPLDNFAVGGWNYGYPYENVNKITLDTFLDPTFLVQEQGFLPPIVNAIGNAAFSFPTTPIKKSWQNSGAGYGMPVLTPKATDKNAQQVPKPTRVSKEDYKMRRGNADILAREQGQNNYNFSMDGSLQSGAQWIKDPTFPIGVYQQLFHSRSF